MPRKIKQYTNPFFKEKVPLVVNGASALLNLQNAIALHQQGQLGQAEAIYQQLLQHQPKNVDVLNQLGVIASQAGRHQSAVNSYDRAIELKPEYAAAYSNRGIALQALKQFDAAVASYDKAIELKPGYAEAYSNRGIALLELKQFDAAVASYDKAIELKPEYADAYYNRGSALQELKQFAAAVASYDKAIELNKYFDEAYYNRGNALLELKQFATAVASYDQAIGLKPDYAMAYSNRGIALQELNHLHAAVSSYDKAIELKPDYAEAYSNRGIALKELKQFNAAVSSYDKAFHLNPNIAYLISNRLHAKLVICDWSNLSHSLLACEEEVATYKQAVEPFISLTLFDKPDVHLKSSKIFMESKYPHNKTLGEITKRIDGGKVRLGYFSADLHHHPVAIWLAEQIENHDKSKFELFAFSFRSDIKDPMNARLKAAFDHFIEVDKMSDLEVAQLSRKLGIDIALDLTGFTVGCRMGIFAARAAPIQVSHLGFPGSMGAEFIDYVISDVHLIPESSQKYFTEKIAYVPCAYTYDWQRKVSEAPFSRAQYGLPEKGFVFTCQNGSQKFMPEVFGIWMEILITVPDSVLWLLEPHPTAVANLTKEAQSRGVESDRLVFTKRETVLADQESARIGRYLASYRLADLFLDTWPYNAGTTAIDALWAGLPVLTKAGVAAVARMATSALQAIEVPELSVSTAQEYKELAVQLATDPPMLKRIKDKVQKNRATSALFDAVGNTRHIENAYIKMYERYQADLQPEHLHITDIDPINKKDLISD